MPWQPNAIPFLHLLRGACSQWHGQPMTSARRRVVGLVGKIQIWHVAPTSIGRGDCSCSCTGNGTVVMVMVMVCLSTTNSVCPTKRVPFESFSPPQGAAVQMISYSGQSLSASTAETSLIPPLQTACKPTYSVSSVSSSVQTCPSSSSPDSMIWKGGHSG